METFIPLITREEIKPTDTNREKLEEIIKYVYCSLCRRKVSESNYCGANDPDCINLS